MSSLVAFTVQANQPIRIVEGEANGLTAQQKLSFFILAHTQLAEEFGSTMMQAIVPLSMYVFALGLGLVVSGLSSETVGRHPNYLVSLSLRSQSLHFRRGVLPQLRRDMHLVQLRVSCGLAILTLTLSNHIHPHAISWPRLGYICTCSGASGCHWGFSGSARSFGMRAVLTQLSSDGNIATCLTRRRSIT